jgi:hypothetical protein
MAIKRVWLIYLRSETKLYRLATNGHLQTLGAKVIEQLPLWNRVPLQRLINAKIFENSLAFYGTRKLK